MLIPQIFRNDRIGDAASDRLCPRPAEERPRHEVPFGDAAFMIRADVGVECRIQHAPCRCLALPELRLRPLSFRDVSVKDTPCTPFIALQWRTLSLYVDHSARLATPSLLT